MADKLWRWELRMSAHQTAYKSIALVQSIQHLLTCLHDLECPKQNTQLCDLCMCSYFRNDVPQHLSGTYPWPQYGAPCIRPSCAILLLCSHSPNDVPHEPQRNVSITAIRGAVRPSKFVCDLVRVSVFYLTRDKMLDGQIIVTELAVL